MQKLARASSLPRRRSKSMSPPERRQHKPPASLCLGSQLNLLAVVRNWSAPPPKRAHSSGQILANVLSPSTRRPALTMGFDSSLSLACAVVASQRFWLNKQQRASRWSSSASPLDHGTYTNSTNSASHYELYKVERATGKTITDRKINADWPLLC